MEEFDQFYEKFFTERYKNDTYKMSPYQELLDDEYKWLLGDTAIFWYRVTMLALNSYYVYSSLALSSSIVGTGLYFTMWGVHLTNVSLLCSLWASGYLARESKIFDYKIMANVSNAVTIPVNFIVTVVSWILIIPYVWFVVAWDTYEGLYYQWLQMSIHTFPFVFSLINTFVLSDTIIYV